MRVRRNGARFLNSVPFSQLHRLQARSITLLDRCAAAQIGKCEGGTPITAVRRSKKREQSRILTNRQKLPFAKGPSTRGEVPAEHLDFPNHAFLLCQSGCPRPNHYPQKNHNPQQHPIHRDPKVDETRKRLGPAQQPRRVRAPSISAARATTGRALVSTHRRPASEERPKTTGTCLPPRKTAASESSKRLCATAWTDP
jgi:hypothetical protein